MNKDNPNKTTKCETRGRHEYRAVRKDKYYLSSQCECGEHVIEEKGSDGRIL